MFFKSLEIHGFKSFADKTVLNFDTRTTAVVGSNGNGKSNISDALRWVMGEQGAKTLRGEKMEDVIFHGTVERKPMGFAKVALTIDNCDRALGVDADEVVISRKLYRSGESEYLINGQKSRLKDIQEMLMGTGLGRDGYSIVGQGRVAEIVNARGSQRREIFEEAAGVSLFLHKKAEAEKQLAHAEENITRQKDIIRVDEERLPVLKRQSEKAALAAELYAEKKELEISVSTARLSQHRDGLKKLDDDLLLNRAESEHYEHDIQKLEDSIEECSEKRMKIQAELERFRRNRQAVNDEIAEQRANIQVLENDLRHNEERRQELAQQIADAEKSSSGFDEDIKATEQKISAKEQDISDIAKRRSETQDKLSEIAEQSAEADKAYSALETALAQCYREKTEAGILSAQAERAEAEAQEQKRVFLEGLNDSEAKLKEYTDSKSEAAKQLSVITEKRAATKNKLSGYERLNDGKKRRMNEAKTALDEVSAELLSKQQRYNVLRDVENNMEGYYRSVKDIIKASKSGRISGIHGIVADVISVEERYVTAIETVLQPVMQHIIVDNEETAKRCIRFLKETNAGRATMLPLTSIKGRSLNEPRLASEQGFEGIASDLVQYDDEYSEIVKNILGTTAVVDDIDTAAYIGKRYGNKFRIVTLDGQVVNAGGSFTGGSKVSAGGIISRKQEIETLYAEIAKLRQSQNEKSEAYRQYQAEMAKFDIEMEGMQDELRALDNEEIRINAELSRLDSLIAQLSQQGETAKLTIERFDAQITQQRSVMENSASVTARTDAEIERLEAQLSESGSERDSAAEDIKRLSDEISQLNISEVAAQKDIDALRAEIRNIENNRKMLFENSGSYKEAVERLESNDKEIRLEIERIRLSIQQQSESLSENDSDIERSTQEMTSLEQRIETMHRDVREATGNKEKFNREVARLEERRAGVQKDYDSIVKLLYDRYELTVSMAVEQSKPLENLMAAENDLAELNKRISALGSVNMDSIEEYRTVSERYEFQTAQLQDIESSKRELEKLIDQLTSDIKTRFLNSFEDINRHFKEIFVSIFGEGARAELELTDPEDVLNSGIEINAAPPGKVIKNLISLSGGEQTMVAITIYFAILKHRPTPFCMLDEVDAALDDVNVDKYITYLNQFCNQTQLMVITHRRGTIEGCEVLYGVFMQEKGVSRLLRRQLTDELDVELK
ncbi:MAG: chromosome segregation protein SMC [Oscillospiraceae bacterium]|nr:chromosome segregation protein SMC [Oscillospiraceae bacterium]